MVVADFFKLNQLMVMGTLHTNPLSFSYFPNCDNQTSAGLSQFDFLNFTLLKELSPNLSESVSLYLLLLLLANFLHCLVMSESKKGSLTLPSESTNLRLPPIGRPSQTPIVSVELEAYRFESERGECFELKGEEEDEEEVSESKKFLQGLFHSRPESPNK